MDFKGFFKDAGKMLFDTAKEKVKEISELPQKAEGLKSQYDNYSNEELKDIFKKNVFNAKGIAAAGLLKERGYQFQKENNDNEDK